MSITLTTIFVSLSVFIFVFVFWNEGCRNGFDQYRLFDTIFVLAALSGLIYLGLDKWFISLKIYHYNSVFLQINQMLFTIFVIYILWVFGIWAFSVYFSWSVYRLFDIFAVAVVLCFTSLVISVLRTPPFLFFLPIYLGYMIIFSRKVMSGINFAIINLISALVLFFGTNLAGKLPISVLLLTITVLVIFFRKKRTMTKTSLPQDFLNFIKNQLRAKEQKLQKQENLLKAEDPYMQRGRSENNADEMDDAILEDSAKELTDTKLGLIKTMRVQIKRALALLKMGKYGVCEICGNPIDKARLKAYPEATMCVHHAAQYGSK